MNILKKRPAMTLLSILASMLVIMIIIVASTPLITKRLQTITTGKAKEGEINLNAARGYFICYKDENGALRSRRVDIAPNQQSGTPVDSNNCNFQIPDADEYRITLIGGGGGGGPVSLSDEPSTPLILHSSSIDFGLTGADFALPSALQAYSVSIQQAIRNAGYGVIVSGAMAYDGGPAGAVCRYDITGEEQNITFETYSGTNAVEGDEVVANKGKNGVVKVDGVSFTIANGGLGMVVNENMSVADCMQQDEGCAFSLKNRDENGNFYYKYGQTNDMAGNGICENAKPVGSGNRGFVDKNNNLVNGIYYQVQKDGVRINRPTSGGKAGQVVSNKYTFISNNAQLNILANNIGNGGASGSSGGNTTLTLTTATGNIDLSAGGGAVAVSIDEDLYSNGDNNPIISKNIESIDGEVVNYVIPNALDMLNFTPGNGGASGSLNLLQNDGGLPYACIVGYCNARLEPQVDNNNGPQGLSGVSGAIIIEW